jgi:hypothetical protein
MKASRDVEGTQVLRGFSIKLVIFLAKARKVLDFLLKHRDLNPIGSTSSYQKPNQHEVNGRCKEVTSLESE